jgi:diguanylate cyclase (GGDEF)-like protein
MPERIIDLEEALDRFRVEFVRASLGRLAEMEALVDRLAAEPGDDASTRSILRHFHGLSGAGGSYGFPHVTELGHEGEAACDEFLAESGAAAADLAAHCSRLIQDLRRDLSVSPAQTMVARPAAAKGLLDILVVEADPELSALLTQLAEGEGMAVRSAATLAQANRELDARMPDGVLVDAGLPDGKGYALVERLRGLPGGEAAAVLIVSAAAEFADRVDAIHCGADGHFPKPLDGQALMRRLEFLLRRPQAEAYRVLSVEDDRDQANFLRAVLKSAGYEVRICADPKTFRTDLAAFRPHLILMDIQLPGTTGYDLARYLRQEEKHATLPVVFLTTQGELASRIEATRAGGDDHMVKPVSPGLLLSTVASRIERARFLQSLLERDGLTRLLSHTAFFERARVATARKRREPAWSCAFVMLDIDHFKSVNDRSGHPVGDRVIASLAALLRRRLRQSDTIGRLGGEEFAILLEGLTEDQAVRLVGRLLLEFSEIEHTAPGGASFRVTASGGIAMLAGYQPDLRSWHEAADAALYAAKRGGRDRVVAASALPPPGSTGPVRVLAPG